MLSGQELTLTTRLNQKSVNILKSTKGALCQWRSDRAKSRLAATPTDPALDPNDFSVSLRDPDGYYRRSFQDFHCHIPAELRAHRQYFSVEGRGFGEDAFHTMWWRLVRAFQPQSFLEIGVFRGQTTSLVSLLAQLERLKCEVYGISPFTPAGDAVSKYDEKPNYYEDTLLNFRHFKLPQPHLLKAYSTDQAALELIASKPWDMIYIDGNHDYDVVLKDWEACSQAVRRGGIIVLDDSGLSTCYKPPVFATGGHPGPSQLASEIDPLLFEEILQVGHNRVYQKC